MVPNISKILIFLFLLTNYPAHSQEIWKESFSIPEKGVWGSNDADYIKSDFSGIINWTLDYSNIFPIDSDDYAKTVSTSGGRFECRDINGEVIWYSEVIDISDCKNVSVQLISQETGSGANESTKFLKAFYKLDGGVEILFEKKGENFGDWGINTVSSTGLNGEKLQIVVYIANFYASDKVILDEVIVSGEENPEPINPGDILISEVLFNPFNEGSDFVEIYNNSEKEIATNRLYLASRDSKLELTQTYPLSTKKNKIMPGEYLCLTKDTNSVFPFFNIKCTTCFLQMEKFPSFNNDEDYVVLLDEEMEIIDELFYTDKLHSPLLADEEGISLERISISKPSSEAGNWHSASSVSGYGTPGYENSQKELENVSKPTITFLPKAFSPNFDGFNDEYLIRYELDKPGYIANITVYDAAGRFVLKLANNEILGTNGTLTWNGEDETGQRQNIGVYVVLVEIFDTKGNVYRFKDGVVLTDVLE